jgi:hypothetical protein
MEGVKKLEDMTAGSVVRYMGVEWAVSDKSVCRESAAYCETEWTLHADGQGETYLLKSEEKKEQGLEEIWVFTRAAVLSCVFCERVPGQWRAFEELDMPSEPPKTVKFYDENFAFEGVTSGKAVDDEGDTVTKVTWDYYSADRSRNLAIEIWKEPDRDYPEAYDGKIVDPSSFEVLDKKADVSAWAASGGGLSALLSGKEPGLSDLPHALGMMLFFAFMMVSSGVPMDYMFAFCMPLFVIAVMVKAALPLWLYLSSVCVWAGMAALTWYTGCRLSFWLITAFCAALSLVVPRLIASRSPDAGRYGRVAFYGVFPALWVYSFFEYFLYAPGPRGAHHFFAACLLPSAAAVFCAFLSAILEKSNV